jgi:HxlR-like helix-turn-helix
MPPDRIYRHLCMTARALEVVGERWSLLIVRELLLGPGRFTDLARGIGEITPSRPTDRLRDPRPQASSPASRRRQVARSGIGSQRRVTTWAQSSMP